MRYLIYIALITTFSLKVYSQNYALNIVDEYSNNENKSKKFDSFLDALTFTENKIEKLHSQGYLHSTFDSIVYFDNLINIYIFKGNQYKIKNISFENITYQELKNIGIKPPKLINKPADFKKIEEELSNIVTYYENTGYPFVSIKFDTIFFLNNDVNFVVKINKGNFYRIDSIYLSGDTEISKKLISRYIDIDPEDIYNEEKFSEISQRIIETEFLTPATAPALEFHKQNADLYLFLSNKKSNSFSGVLGFLPDIENDKKILITGDINLKIVNTFNTGETIKFSWQKYQTKTQNLDILFSFPFLAGTQFGIKEDFGIEKKDTTFLKIDNLADLQFFTGGLNYISAFVKFSNSQLLNNTFVQNLEYNSLKSSIYGFSFFNQKLDYTLNPSKGYSFLLKSGIGTKTLKDSTNSEQFDNELNIELYFRLYKKTVLKFQNQSALIYNKHGLFLNELYQLGGLKTLRGFDENSVSVSRYSVSSLEIRYLFEKNSNVYIFYDFGYLLKETTTDYFQKFSLSFGTGLNFTTDAGCFSLSYALGKFYGDNFILRNAKIHFGFTSFF